MTAILEPHKTLLAFLSCPLALLLLVSCGQLSTEQSRQVNEALQDSLTSTTETWQVDMEIMEEGLKKVRVRGSYAATYTSSEKNETRIKGPVNIHVFDSTGTVKTRVSCDRAVYKAEDAVFELYGNVNVNARDARHLESEYLEWKQDKNTISTPNFVVITTPTDSIAGSGFHGTSDLTDYTIKQPKGRVVVD